MQLSATDKYQQAAARRQADEGLVSHNNTQTCWNPPSGRTWGTVIERMCENEESEVRNVTEISWASRTGADGGIWTWGGIDCSEKPVMTQWHYGRPNSLTDTGSWWMETHTQTHRHTYIFTQTKYSLCQTDQQILLSRLNGTFCPQVLLVGPEWNSGRGPGVVDF